MLEEELKGFEVLVFYELLLEIPTILLLSEVKLMVTGGGTEDGLHGSVPLLEL
jgi:hypothetical protein